MVLLCCAVTHLAAQQVYPDTFRLAEQKATVEMDAYLLDLVHQQSVALHANDTIDTLTVAEVLRLDSIRREQAEVDSLRALNASLVLKKPDSIPLIAVEKSWIKDEQEDRNDVLRAIRDAHSPGAGKRPLWRRSRRTT